MKVSFLRHGQTQANAERVLQGMVDTSINDRGKEQARAAAQQMKDLSFDCVYCSPLLRACQTAEIVLQGKDVPIHYDHRLRERSFGEFELRPFSELMDAGYDWERSYQDDDYSLFGIEPLGSVRERIYEFLDELKRKDHRHVLIVSHGAVSMLFRQYFLGEHTNWSEHRLENCQFLDFELQE